LPVWAVDATAIGAAWLFVGSMKNNYAEFSMPI
jgi:hypothetical protein